MKSIPIHLGGGFYAHTSAFFSATPKNIAQMHVKMEHVRTCFYFELCKGIDCGFKGLV